MTALSYGLLIFSTAIAVICTAGIIGMRDLYDKLHYLAPVSILSTASIAAAIAIEKGLLSQSGIKSVLVLIVMAISGPVITHAVARAEVLRQTRGEKGK